METTNKAGSFLEALKKYSEKERQQTLDEAAAEKAEQLKKADEKGKADADRYVKKLISAKKVAITSEYSVKILESKGEVFKRRDEMVGEVFDSASKKLDEFSHSEGYREKLLAYAAEIAEAFGENSCELSIKPGDMKYADDIRSAFNSSVEIKEDVRIRLGGLRGFCPALKLVADNTLDSKLEAQKEWFIENADLKIG